LALIGCGKDLQQQKTAHRGGFFLVARATTPTPAQRRIIR
jgi:hypothetical protein